MRPPGATGERTRERLTAAAIELFAQRGFAATGIRDIATAAGLSSSSLYEYITTKDDLLVEIMVTTIQPLVEAGSRLTAAATSPEWLLAALTRNHVWFHATHPHRTMVTDTELRSLDPVRRETVVVHRDRYESIWRDAVAAGVSAGVFDVDDVEVCARSLISLCTGIGGWYRPGGRLTIDRLCMTHVDLALAAVRAVRDGSPVRSTDL
jgi:AcrR family transcriptional regulator